MSPTNVIIPNSFSMDWPERYISPTLSRAYRILSNAFLVKNRGISPWMLDENFPFFAPVATCMISNPQPTALCAISGSANKRFYSFGYTDWPRSYGEMFQKLEWV